MDTILMVTQQQKSHLQNKIYLQQMHYDNIQRRQHYDIKKKRPGASTMSIDPDALLKLHEKKGNNTNNNNNNNNNDNYNHNDNNNNYNNSQSSSHEQETYYLKKREREIRRRIDKYE